MNVLIDTNIWSLVLRRRTPLGDDVAQKFVEEMGILIAEGRARIIGPIRQELLAGIREKVQFEKAKLRLRALEDEVLRTADFELAAGIDNECRAKGIAGASTDFLICAVALRRTWMVFTADRDFNRYAKVVPFKLHDL